MSKIQNLAHEDRASDPVDLSSSIKTHLKMLLSIVDKVENPSFAVTLTEILELLFDFGYLLSNSHEFDATNPEVFEDPFGKSDSLGNILMIHHRRTTTDHAIAEKMGESLLDIAHFSQKALLSGRSTDDVLDQITPILGSFDDTRSEDILSAKKLVYKLRKENGDLDRRNNSIFHRMCHYQDLVTRYEERLGIAARRNTRAIYATPELAHRALDHLCSFSNHKPELDQEEVKSIETALYADRDGKPLSTPRKCQTADTSLSDSQTEFSFGGN